MKQRLHASQGIAAGVAVALLLTGLVACNPGTTPDPEVENRELIAVEPEAIGKVPVVPDPEVENGERIAAERESVNEVPVVLDPEVENGELIAAKRESIVGVTVVLDPDLNGDGVVNILDVSLVASCQGLDFSGFPQCAAADTDGDGDVDRDDLDFVVADFGETGFPFCGDNTMDPGEQCDGSDDAACPDRCQVDCTCGPLSIDIETPLADLVTDDDSVAVAGTFGAGVTSVEVSGVAATLGGGTFSATVPLRAGPNMLVAIARDDEGNTGTDSVVVTRDTIAPNVQINSPPSGFKAIVDHVTVTGIVNDIITGGIDPRVQVNGLEAFVQQGTFMVMDVPLVRGPNTLVAIAVDVVGNEGIAEISVSFDPPAGAKLEPVSGDGQAALVGTTVAEPLVVRIVDDAGNALASRVVRFEILRSSGSLATDAGANGRVIEVPSDGAGLARVSLTLGNRSGEGNNQVRASSVSASGVALFCATGQPALPSKIFAAMGENQKGQAGSPLPEPFEVLVVDVDGNPVAGASVTYSVIGGGGNFDGQPSKTLGVGADGVGRAVLTLGPAEGINNNVVSVTFPDNPGIPASFVSSAMVAGQPEDTRFAGVVLDNTNSPIPGATVHIPGSAGDVLTDAEGQFLVAGVPVGAIHLEIDPSTSSRPEIFPNLAFEATTVAGRINRLPVGPIRIPPLVSDAQVVGGPEDVVLRMPGVPGLTVTVFANSATFLDGSSVGLASVNQVHLDKVPMPPPRGALAMPPAWTLQPPGLHFDPPAAVTIPNDGLPPGRVIDIFSFDHDVNRFVNIGPGTVDEEGLLIVSDPGFGITKAGWGMGGPPPPPTTCAGSCDDGDDCTADGCRNGACVNEPKPPEGPACSASSAVQTSYPEHFNQGHGNPGTAFASTLPHISDIEVNTTACLSGGKYMLVVTSAVSPVDIDVSPTLGGRDDCDAVTPTATNYCERGAGQIGIIDDLDDQEYQACISGSCNLAHERAHRKEWEDIWDARFPALQTGIQGLMAPASASVCTPAKAVAQLKPQQDALVSTVRTAANSQWNTGGEGVNGEAAENACNAVLINVICAVASAQGFPACSLCPTSN